MTLEYRQTDKYLRLVMILIALCCTPQIRAPNIDFCAPEISPWPLTLTHDLDPDLWPWTQPLTLKQGNIVAKHNFRQLILTFEKIFYSILNYFQISPSQSRTGKNLFYFILFYYHKESKFPNLWALAIHKHLIFANTSIWLIGSRQVLSFDQWP